MNKETAFKHKIMKRYHNGNNMVVPIESKTRAGIPDLWVCNEKKSFWIELKQLKNKVFDRDEIYTIPFRPGQLAFHKEVHAISNGREQVLVCIEFKNGIGYYWNRVDLTDTISGKEITFERNKF